MLGLPANVGNQGYAEDQGNFDLGNNVPGQDYQGAPLPANEEQRLETVCGMLKSLDEPVGQFDDITKLVTPFTYAVQP